MAIESGVIPQPTRTELNILNILWNKGRCTVREVHEALNQVEPSGYTTALKMLQVMHQKGQVLRDDSERAHVYYAAVSKDQTQNLFLADLADRLFDGSTSRLVMQALGSSPKADSAEVERIRELLSNLNED
ncbi:MAG TPA: BlaI/MecI/CopY family transcriptional regulator [Xanthomonadales bacterium]|nr:BlaI/MecI/CopY family transcriptional regulator [Xanthomonadales bacterium]